MVIVFDLDDTLYDDISFVLSGFRKVAEYLSTFLDVEQEDIYNQLVIELQVNRNQVFDRFLEKHGIFQKKLVSKCISIYRKHHPLISLFPEADECINRLKKNPLYVVTDGNKLVQKNKFVALGLAKRIKKCICTYAYGLTHSKPSPYCFQKICEWENVSPSEIVYIADNPKKDFVGIKPLGFCTIRVLTGPYRNLNLGSEYDADMTISNLSELNENLLKDLMNK
ncbi:MAG: HAD hydrolase-like protein [Parachlamydiaceae bacterium]|nr:HAD hydrolase-like protein [Parachlamydiaceae bacterium]